MFDHAQSPRLGQKVAPEQPGIQIVTVATLPQIAWPGRLVFAADTASLMLYNGSAWQSISQGATGSQTFVGPTQPTADNVGDLWLNTADFQLYVWNGVSWVASSNTAQQRTNLLSYRLLKAVEIYITPASDPLITVTYDTTSPTSPATNDFWVNPASNVAQYWDGATYQPTDDDDDPDYPAETWLVQAGEARAVPDAKIDIYYQTLEPTSLDSSDIGDVWVDDSESVRVWNGGFWELVVFDEDTLINGYDVVDSPRFLSMDADWKLISSNSIYSNGFVQLYAEVKYIGSTLSVPASGNITNSLIGKFNYKPDALVALSTAGVGRVANFVINKYGNVSLASVGGTPDIEAGDKFSISGLFLGHI